jgi:hypothetical protein
MLRDPLSLLSPASDCLRDGKSSSDILEPSRSAASSYTAIVTKKRDRERDIVRELQEDAKWSMWTNTFGRQRGWGRPRSLPYGPGVRTYMLAAVLILGTVVAVIGLIALLLNLN